MKEMIKEYVLAPFLLFALIPIFTVFILLGFRHCWQCGNLVHRFQMKKHKLNLFKDTNELVCKHCYSVLNESR